MNTYRPYNICYQKLKTDKNKKIILIKYNKNNKLQNFVFQTPTLLNLYEPNECNGYSEIEIALENKDKSKVSSFTSYLNELEKKIKKDAVENAGLWFDLDNNVINFQKIIRESTNHENGTLKLKLINNKDFETEIQLNGLKSICSNCLCKMILECYAIWVNQNNDFGIFFRPIVISFSPNKELYNYNFIEDTESEGDIDIPDTEISTNQLFLKGTNKNKIDDNTSSTILDMKNKYNNFELNSELLKSNLDKISLSDDTSNDEFIRERLKDSSSD